MSASAMSPVVRKALGRVHVRADARRDTVHLPAGTERGISNPHDDWPEFLSIIGLPAASPG